MKLFTRPEPEEYHEYYTGYLANVHDGVQDILMHLKKQGLIYLEMLKRMNDEQADSRYEEGKWSIKEVIGHLIDTERLFAFRALWMARGDKQPQPGMDPDLWAGNSSAGVRTLPELWREQHVARTDHVYLFRSFRPEEVVREGVCSGYRLTVRAIPWIIAGHEKHHLNVLVDRYGVELP